MQAIRFDYEDPSFPASLIDVDEPKLPNAQWARIAVSIGGICGSDLSLFGPVSKLSPTLIGVADFPFILGHEIVGEVIESGADCPIPVGTRVAVDPCIPCEARGIVPVCKNCAKGWTSSCLMLDSSITAGGRALGFTKGFGGGWAEQTVAHRSMLHPIPDSLSATSAVLHEPVSIAAHALMRQPPPEKVPVLIVGAGIIGLATLAAMRGLFPDSPVTVLARYEHQAKAARTLGADTVISTADGKHFLELAKLTDSRLVGTDDDPMLMGGFSYVVEAVGAPRSITEALRAVAHRGTVLLLGAAGITEVDLSPLWYKEVMVVGSVDHCIDLGSAPGLAGLPGRHSIDRAIDILVAGIIPAEVVVTHEFPLEAYRDAIGTALDKTTTGAIKVVFRPK